MTQPSSDFNLTNSRVLVFGVVDTGQTATNWLLHRLREPSTSPLDAMVQRSNFAAVLVRSRGRSGPEQAAFFGTMHAALNERFGHGLTLLVPSGLLGSQQAYMPVMDDIKARCQDVQCIEVSASRPLRQSDLDVAIMPRSVAGAPTDGRRVAVYDRLADIPGLILTAAGMPSQAMLDPQAVAAVTAICTEMQAGSQTIVVPVAKRPAPGMR